MNLLTAASAVEGRLVGNDVDFERVVTDSRELSGGELFVALKGENFDGHEFVEEAQNSGAVAAMASQELQIDLPTLVVGDTTLSLGRLAAYWRCQFNLPVVAVTGSNGKTKKLCIAATFDDVWAALLFLSRHQLPWRRNQRTGFRCHGQLLFR